MEDDMDTTPDLRVPIVIDGMNVAHEYGRCRGFAGHPDPLGIVSVSLAWASQHHPVVIVLPRAQEGRMGPALHPCISAGANIVYSRMGGQDDLFVLSCAREREGFVVSNDAYRAEIEGSLAATVGEHEARRMRAWLTPRLISYTFIEGEGGVGGGGALLAPLFHPLASAAARFAESSRSARTLPAGAGAGEGGAAAAAAASVGGTDDASARWPQQGGGGAAGWAYAAAAPAGAPPAYATLPSQPLYPVPSSTSVHHHAAASRPGEPGAAPAPPPPSLAPLPPPLAAVEAQFPAGSAARLAVRRFGPEVFRVVSTALTHPPASAEWAAGPPLAAIAAAGARGDPVGTLSMRLSVSKPEDLAVGLVRLLASEAGMRERERAVGGQRGVGEGPEGVVRGMDVWSAERVGCLRAGLQNLLGPALGLR
jgi:hypothetical protein